MEVHYTPEDPDTAAAAVPVAVVPVLGTVRADSGTAEKFQYREKPHGFKHADSPWNNHRKEGDRRERHAVLESRIVANVLQIRIAAQHFAATI